VTIIRLTKLLMVCSLAAFGLLVAYDNLADYNANYLFVQHVLSMDTVFPDNALRHRAITDPLVWKAAYAAIIAAEALTGLIFAAAAIAMARTLRAPAHLFERAKRPVMVGAGLAFLLWFLGFMVVGGEWFAMWQSRMWNGQEAAFRFYISVLAVTILVLQPDDDLRP
jgi:predicted small integral membrane protein